MTQTPSSPMRLEPPPPQNPYHTPRTHTRVRRSTHPYHHSERYPQAQPVRQRNAQVSPSSVSSLVQLPEDIFRFLDLSEINMALQEDMPSLYIIMFSNPSMPFVVSITHWARLGKINPVYHLKTTIARHQCST